MSRSGVPVLCDDGVLQNLLLGLAVLALLRQRRPVLLFLEFATHVVWLESICVCGKVVLLQRRFTSASLRRPNFWTLR
jgi:hypothetical protein